MDVCAVCEFWVQGKIQNFGCVAIGSSVLFILRSRFLLYSAGSRVNRVKLLSGFSARLLCFVQRKTLCMYFLAALVLVCLNVMSSA